MGLSMSSAPTNIKVTESKKADHPQKSRRESKQNILIVDQ